MGQQPQGDRAHDVLGYERQPLGAIFNPRHIAVVGATDVPGSVGRAVLANLTSGTYRGTVHPVNPRHTEVLHHPAYPSVRAIPHQIDLAVVVTPAATVPDVIQECVEVGVGGAIIISAGFRERGAVGAELEQEILARARRGRLRLIGPNCLGIMRPRSGLNATFLSAMARPGPVGFVSQSGALGSAILDWSTREHVGFSAFVSVGSMLDVGWGDLIYYLGDDPETECIVVYMESIGDARAFVSAAREVSYTKPIIVIKAGKTAAAATAAASHTGALTGSDAVLDAALRRCGVLRVNTIAELFYMAEVLSKQPRPRGPRLTIVTNAGGPGVLATDALVGHGGELAPLSEHTRDALDMILPAHWSHGNPVDVLGDATPERLGAALDVVIKDETSDGTLVIFAPQSSTDPRAAAEQLRPFATSPQKPLLASWMGGPSVEDGEALLNELGIPTFSYPDTAAVVFHNMWRYSYNLRLLYETPALPSADAGSRPDRAWVSTFLQQVRETGRTIITEIEAKQILAAYGLPTVPTFLAPDVDEAERVADSLGYPVVLKIHSEQVIHKSDVGGVRLDLPDGNAVRQAFAAIEDAANDLDFRGVSVQPMVSTGGYELIVGSSTDSQFGPVLLFGSGGRLVEVYGDRAIALPPLNTTLARRLMEQTRVFQALKGVRASAGLDLQRLEQFLVVFSQLVVEQSLIKEIDINPLLISSGGLSILDASMILHGPEIADVDLPRPAIRPYPTQYISLETLRDGSTTTIRPIRAEDEPLMIQFHQGLSAASVYARYFHVLKLDQRVAHERLTRICFIDYDREMALVAERIDPANGMPVIMGVGRLSKLHGTQDAEFAVLIGDSFQRLGLGSLLLRNLVRIGRDEGLRRIVADILPENRGMRLVSERLGFRLRHRVDDDVVRAVLDLGADAAARS